MAIYIANYVPMKVANIAEFKDNLAKYLRAVAQGETIEIRKRNVPLARVVPVTSKPLNKTRLGLGRGTATAHGDLTEPQIPEQDWEMLGG